MTQSNKTCKPVSIKIYSVILSTVIGRGQHSPANLVVLNGGQFCLPGDIWQWHFGLSWCEERRCYLNLVAQDNTNYTTIQGQLHTKNNYLVQNVHGADIGKLWVNPIVFGIDNDHSHHQSIIQHLLSVYHMSVELWVEYWRYSVY